MNAKIQGKGRLQIYLLERSRQFLLSVFNNFSCKTSAAFAITRNPNYNGYQQGFASMVPKFFGKKTLLPKQEQEQFLRINNWLIIYTGPSLENLKTQIIFVLPR